MKKYIILFVLFLLPAPHVAYSNDNLGFGAYMRDINTPAAADAVNMHDAWSENTAARIEDGTADGIVIDIERDTDQYTSDGVGNVIVKDGANVGPIINKTDLSNTVVIIKRY